MQNEDRTAAPSRRTIVNGLGSGLVAAPAMLASAQALAQAGGGGGSGGRGSGGGGGSAGAGTALPNPTENHPQPPFPRQEQPWPGLAARMEPRPDHGEESYRGSGRLAGRKALVTGGDSGIGRAAVIAYAREGADIAFNYLEAEQPDAEAVIELVRREGRTCVPIPGDIRQESFCRDLVEQAARDLGGLDILVNNAARQTAQRSIEDISTEQFDDTLKTNLYAMFWITKAALRHLPTGASIINTASVVAYDPPEQLLDYSLTKAGIVNYTKGLAKQLAERGIRVNAVAPGPFWTPLQPSGGQFPQSRVDFGAATPLGRPGQPAEIAYLYVLLALPGASYVTGSVYGATGGGVGP